MKGSVSAWWINALLITVTAFMWLSVAAGVIAGIAIADAASSDGTTVGNCNYDAELDQFYNLDGNICTP